MSAVLFDLLDLEWALDPLIPRDFDLVFLGLEAFAFGLALDDWGLGLSGSSLRRCLEPLEVCFVWVMAPLP